MSSYKQMTLNPESGKWENADWIDNYFAPHHYGVQFADGKVIDPDAVELMTRDYTDREKLDIEVRRLRGRNKDLEEETVAQAKEIGALRTKLGNYVSFFKTLRKLLLEVAENDKAD